MCGLGRYLYYLLAVRQRDRRLSSQKLSGCLGLGVRRAICDSERMNIMASRNKSQNRTPDPYAIENIAV